MQLGVVETVPNCMSVQFENLILLDYISELAPALSSQAITKPKCLTTNLLLPAPIL
jgi:hypothetical protein